MPVDPEDLARAARKLVRDGVTTSIGLGLLLLQRAQVQRREMLRGSAHFLQTLGRAIEQQVDGSTGSRSGPGDQPR